MSPDNSPHSRQVSEEICLVLFCFCPINQPFNQPTILLIACLLPYTYIHTSPFRCIRHRPMDITSAGTARSQLFHTGCLCLVVFAYGLYTNLFIGHQTIMAWLCCLVLCQMFHKEYHSKCNMLAQKYSDV